MFWKFRWMLFLPLFLPAWGQPAPEFWKPAPRSSHLEILSPLGGWQTAGTAEIRLKLTDPTDPRPPLDSNLEYWERWQARWKAEEKALQDRIQEIMAQNLRPEPPARARLLAWIQGDPKGGAPVSADEITFIADWLKAREEAQGELNDAKGSREHSLLAFFNGEVQLWDLELNRERTFKLELIQGENRLEILDPSTGQSQLRTWWCEGSSPRLQVFARELGASLDFLGPPGTRT